MVTGATSGLGRSIARHFAVAGFELVLHGRSRRKLDALSDEVVALGARVHAVCADITETGDVAAMVEAVRERFDSLDVVVNNAAIGGGVDPTRREVNSAGVERRLAANYLAPYQINRGLLPLLHSAPQGRIVNVASIGQAPIDLGDITFTRRYDGVEAYCRSKLALIMDTIDLAAALDGTRVTVNAVHPAHLMATTMVRDSGFDPEATVEDGVLPVLRLALDTALSRVSGEYFDRFEIAAPHPQAHDDGVRAELAQFAEAKLLHW